VTSGGASYGQVVSTEWSGPVRRVRFTPGFLGWGLGRVRMPGGRSRRGLPPVVGWPQISHDWISPDRVPVFYRMVQRETR